MQRVKTVSWKLVLKIQFKRIEYCLHVNELSGIYTFTLKDRWVVVSPCSEARVSGHLIQVFCVFLFFQAHTETPANLQVTISCF